MCHAWMTNSTSMCAGVKTVLGDRVDSPIETPRCVLHADADRFYFAVEAIERPELAVDTRPIIVGHDPRESPRAVVTTANDAARRLGIDSGLSCRIALGRAPD